jgi:hypothetical protein
MNMLVVVGRFVSFLLRLLRVAGAAGCVAVLVWVLASHSQADCPRALTSVLWTYTAWVVLEVVLELCLGPLTWHCVLKRQLDPQPLHDQDAVVLAV